MRLRTLFVFVCLATAAHAAPPAPAATQNAVLPPGYKPPPPPRDDAVQWNGDVPSILVVTDKVKAELEAKPGYRDLRIVLRHGATDAHAAAMAAKLPWIRTLVTDEPTALTSLSALAGLKSLQELHLNTNRIVTLAPLAGHPSLKALTLTCSASFTDADLSALSSVATLENLDLRTCTSIKDFAGIEKLASLRGLTSWNCPVKRLDPLAPLVKLTALTLRNTLATDLAPLGRLGELAVLDLSGIQALSFAPLRFMTKLSSLTLDETNVPSLDVVTSTQLWNLQLSRTKKLTSLAGLPASLPRFTMLRATGSAITSIDPVAAIPSLQYVSFEETSVVHIHALMKLPQLKSVDLAAGVPDAELLALKSAIPGIQISRYGNPPPGFVPGPPIP